MSTNLKKVPAMDRLQRQYPEITGGKKLMPRLVFFGLALALLCPGTVLGVTVRDAVFTTRNAGRVVFSHGVHLNKKEMANNCRACHDGIFSLKTKKHFSMAEMVSGRSCGACHDGSKAFSLKKCSACHITREKIYQVKATGATLFSHERHLAGIPDCRVCHPKPFVAGVNKRFSMANMDKGASCGACHNGKKAFSVKECASCHPTREVIYKDKDAGDVTFKHASHGSMYTCSQCHPQLYKTSRSKVKVSMKDMENGRSCGACHDGKSAFGVRDACESCHKI